MTKVTSQALYKKNREIQEKKKKINENKCKKKKKINESSDDF